MSDCFGAYAGVYDRFYRKKDYAAEAEYVAGLLGRRDGTLLDLGCGTASHDVHFAAMGFEVTGVDLSATMLDGARAKLPGHDFLQGDVRTVRLGRRFDSVVSLFHVMSYLPTQADLAAAIATAAEHLKDGGRLVLDFWHGPAVEADPPGNRTAEAEGIRRITTSSWDRSRHMVEVNFRLQPLTPDCGLDREVVETHAMRYLWADDVAEALAAAGLRPLAFHDWLSDRPPSATSWNACCVATR
jgi:SAM-dependent methyltransferase